MTRWLFLAEVALVGLAVTIGTISTVCSAIDLLRGMLG